MGVFWMVEVKRSAVTVFAIGLKTPTEEVHGFNEAAFVLRSLTQDTGGRAFFVSKSTDLDAVYQQIADELANQYMIGYTSTNHRLDGAWYWYAQQIQRPTLYTVAKQKGLTTAAVSKIQSSSVFTGLYPINFCAFAKLGTRRCMSSNPSTYAFSYGTI